MADKVNFTIEQGTDFRRAMELRDENGALLNLTGYLFRGQVRDDYESKIILNIVFTIRDQDAFTGMVDLHITSNSTAILKMIKKTEYIYDIEMVDAAEEVRRVMEGKISINPEVTK